MEAAKKHISMKSVLFKVLVYGLLLAGLLLILYPLYITVITAFKSPAESTQNFFAFPKSLYLENFKSVFKKANYLRYFMNSIFVTVVSVAVIMLLTPMCAYAISRNMKKSILSLFICIFWQDFLFRFRHLWFRLLIIQLL